MKNTALHVIVAALFVAFVGTALADTAPAGGGGGGGGADVYMQVHVPDPKDPKQMGKAPGIDVTVVGGPSTTADKLTLSTVNKGVKVTMKADKLRPYGEGTETIAIALVINGQMIWIGNDDYEQDESVKYAGVLKNLEQAIDKLQLGNAGPAGSKATVISYSTGAEVKVALTDLKNITGQALGSQQDYKGKLGTDMVSGIGMAMSELQKATTARKALIVVGDGNDTNNETAKPQLAELKKQAAKSGIQLFAIIYKSAVSTEGAVITTMIPTAKTANSIEDIQAELSQIIARMADRYYVAFSGFDEKTGESLPWDGKEHDLVLKIDQTETDPVTMTMSPVWALPVKSSFPWLIVILSAVGLLLLIIIIKAATRKKPEPMPMPMPMPMAAAPEPPKPMGPSKTVMIGAGGDQEGFPIVGWLVPLNGSNAYQTWRLKPGLTKIGTAPPSDLVVNDGFMSTEHCSITCSPAGFTLHDGGSTNGCYVNDRKVQKQDLVDNDVIMLGKTNFKFKSIN
jgi:FHA domain/von Willebrand factor type A domain